jgi:hypothetical protein
MRITVNVADELGEAAKAAASNARVSVSRITQQALEYYLIEMKRKRLGRAVLGLVGKTRVDESALDAIDEGRADDRP